jgi:uncharacterized protein with von Willebrand factor type A (vWA) domain
VEAQKQLAEKRRREATPIPRSRSKRLVETERRMREQLDARSVFGEAPLTGAYVVEFCLRCGARPEPPQR